MATSSATPTGICGTGTSEHAARQVLMRDDPGPQRQPRLQGPVHRADARPASLAPILTKLRAGGVTSSGALAAALTARNIPTLSGRGSWSAARVHHLVRRIARLDEGAASSRKT
jgi:hypothetical protein